MTAQNTKVSTPDGRKQASPWIARYLPMIRQQGHVLDLAAGSGRHGRLALDHGHIVTFLDRDLANLTDLSEHPQAKLLCANLEDGSPLPLKDQDYDAVVVTNYLFRPLLPKLADLLRPNGVLIYETFAIGNEAYGRPRNPDFLLAPNELLYVYLPRLQIVAFEHGHFHDPSPRVCQRITAVNLFGSDLPQRD